MAPSSSTQPRTIAHEFYASCPEGFEVALEGELRELGMRQVRRLKGRVTFAGDLADAYRACLWSRLASRVFVTVARFDCHDADDLYEGTSTATTPTTSTKAPAQSPGRASSRPGRPLPSPRAASPTSCATRTSPRCASKMPSAIA